MKKILITGNSGYIGSHLSKMLMNTLNYEVHGLDVCEPQYPLHRFYLQDINKIFTIDEEFDCVIHLAAKVNVGESVQQPTLYYQTNTFGTLNVLKSIKTKNFIFASTGAAESMACPYGISKRAAEEIVTEYCTNNKNDYTIFRFYNVIGQDGINPTNPDGLFFNLIKAATTGNFNLYGDDYNTKDGSCVRDYVHVNEICNALMTSINTPSKKIENLGHGTGHTVKEIIQIFKDVNTTDFDVNVLGRRDGDIEYSVLSNPSAYIKPLYKIEDLLRINIGNT
jgi:UDP-glucose 4-epimerase